MSRYDQASKRILNLCKPYIDGANLTDTNKKRYTTRVIDLITEINLFIIRIPQNSGFTVEEQFIKLENIDINNYFGLYIDKIIDFIYNRSKAKKSAHEYFHSIILILENSDVDITKFRYHYECTNPKTKTRLTTDVKKSKDNESYSYKIEKYLSDHIKTHNITNATKITYINFMKSLALHVNNKIVNLSFLEETDKINLYLLSTYNVKKTLKGRYSIIKSFLDNDSGLRKKYSVISSLISKTEKDIKDITLDDLVEKPIYIEEYILQSVNTYSDEMKIFLINILKDKKLTDGIKYHYMNYLKNFAVYINNGKLDLSFLNDSELCKQYITERYNSHSASTKSHILCAIIKVLNENDNEELYKSYKDLLYYYSYSENKERGNSFRTYEEINNWIDYGQIDNYHKDIEDYFTYTYDGLFIESTDYNYLNELNAYIIFSLYTLRAPLRYDYNKLIITNNIIDNDNNYLELKENIIIIHLNQYKNVNSWGSKQIIIDGKLYFILSQWIDILTKVLNKQPTYLFHNFKEDDDGKLIIENNTKTYIINDGLNYIVEKFIDAEKFIDVSFLRKCYTTHLIDSEEYKNMSFRDKQEKHSELLHSFETAHRDYYAPIKFE